MSKFRILVFVKYTEEVTREYQGLQSLTVSSFNFTISDVCGYIH